MNDYYEPSDLYDEPTPDYDDERVIECNSYAHVDEDQQHEAAKPEATLVGKEESGCEEKVQQRVYKRQIFWAFPSAERRMPNLFVRSSLFSATKLDDEDKRTFNNERLVVWGDDADQNDNDREMFYTGTQLDQYDLAVFESLLYLAGGRRVGGSFRVSASMILKVMGFKSDGGLGIKRVKKSLDRLVDAHLTIIDKSIEVPQSLYIPLPEGFSSEREFMLYKQTVFDDNLIYRDYPGQDYLIRLPGQLKALCGEKFTTLDFNVLKNLVRKPLAAWLYRYFASHKAPKDPCKYQYGISTLSWLSGVSKKPLHDELDRLAYNKFKRSLLDSLKTLNDVTTNAGKPYTYVQSAWDNDNVAIKR